jgi:hypothetical protein
LAIVLAALPSSRSRQEASNNASPLPVITKLAFAAVLAFVPASSEIRKTPQGEAVVRSQGVQDDEAALLTRIISWLTKRRIGRGPLGLRVRARDSRRFRQIVRMDLYAVSRGAIPVRLKELAHLKVALMVGCPF